MGHGDRGVTPLPFGQAPPPSNTALAACQKGFISAPCGCARSPSVLHDPWQRGQGTAVAQKSVAARREGARRDVPALQRSGRGQTRLSAPLLLAPSFRSWVLCAPTPSQTNAPRETQGLKSVGPGGLPKTISFLQWGKCKKQLKFHPSCSLTPADNCRCF